MPTTLLPRSAAAALGGARLLVLQPVAHLQPCRGAGGSAALVNVPETPVPELAAAQQQTAMQEAMAWPRHMHRSPQRHLTVAGAVCRGEHGDPLEMVSSEVTRASMQQNPSTPQPTHMRPACSARSGAGPARAGRSRRRCWDILCRFPRQLHRVLPAARQLSCGRAEGPRVQPEEQRMPLLRCSPEGQPRTVAATCSASWRQPLRLLRSQPELPGQCVQLTPLAGV